MCLFLRPKKTEFKLFSLYLMLHTYYSGYSVPGIYDHTIISLLQLYCVEPVCSSANTDVPTVDVPKTIPCMNTTHSFFKSHKYLKNILDGRHWSWIFEKACLLRVKRRGFFILFVLLFCFVVSFFLTAFNLENKAFYYVLPLAVSWYAAYENQV